MIQASMKTFRKTVRTIAAIKIIFLSILILTGQRAFTQGTLSGVVVDDEFSTPLEKAVITIPGTLISVLTDQQGKFAMKLVGGNYSIMVNYPGHFEKFYNVSISEGISTPMFIIKLKANAVGREMQRKISGYETPRQFPQSLEPFTCWPVDEQKGHQEFNEIFRSVASVNYQSNGSSLGQSGIGFRGNNASHTSYTFNGILLNNPETGRVNPVMFAGLTDWAGQIQAISGQAANLQDQTASGGLINVLSYLPQEKAGVEVLAVYGNAGFLKTSATIHTGQTKKGWASSLQFSRTAGDGTVQNSDFEQYGFFIDLRKEINHKHTLVLNLNGVLQQRNLNGADSIGAYNFYGPQYNKSWGFLAENPVSWSGNYERSPLISLTHFWQPRKKTHLTTQVFAQLNNSAQIYADGRFNRLPLDSLPRDENGHLQVDQVTNWNQGLEATGMGSVRVADAEGKFINTDTSGVSLLAAIDREYRFGLRSVLTREISKKLQVQAAVNLERYQARHSGVVHDLLSANGYFSFADANQTSGFQVDKLFNTGFYPNFQSPGAAAYSYLSLVQSGGLAFRINYLTKRFYWYLESAGSLRNMQRTDDFNYLNTDPDRKPSTGLLAGGRAQTGFRINFWKYHSIHLRTGYSSSQPLFITISPVSDNWKNNNVKNEQVFDAELGYTIFSRKLKIETLAYRAEIYNRAEIRRSNLRPDHVLGLINGLHEVHQGVELKSSYKLTKNLQLYLNSAYGDWKYTVDATAQLLDNNHNTETSNLLIKNIRVANAPQLSIFGEVEYRWAHNFYVRLNYYRADRIYAPFGLSDFKNLADRSDFVQWQLPAYQLLGASGNYQLKIGKSQMLNIIFGANNLLDSEYIEQSTTNFPEGNSRYTSNLVYYGMGRTWFAGIRVQF